MEITYTDEVKVELIETTGGDVRIAHAAMVSTQGGIEGNEPPTNAKVVGLINYLIKHRHGTPFEHGSLTFRVHAPIFVFREHHRHRIGFSYNEESARYKTLEPIFWLPKPERPLMKIEDPGLTCTQLVQHPAGAQCDYPLEKIENGHKRCLKCGFNYKYSTSARPFFGPASSVQHQHFCDTIKGNYEMAYWHYRQLVDLGYAREAARAVLPVGIYSSCWVTCNPRSLMHFLSLRTHDPEALFISYPQFEIELVARAYEDIFQLGWPITYKAFCENRRVAP